MSDLIRETKRAMLVALKADAPLLALLPKTSIDPIAEDPAWPFIRVDSPQATLEGQGCSTRSEVTLRLHSFAKPRYEANVPVETAEEHTGRINAAAVTALRNRAFEVAGRRYRFEVTNSQLMQDGAERSAYHGICTVVARAYQG